MNCPRCGSVMAKRDGKFGPFWGCSSFPKCKGSRNPDGSTSQSQFATVPEDEDDPGYDTVAYDGIYRIQDFGMDPMDWGDR